MPLDDSYGFEMETFEFLNMLQVHGFPKVMGVLTKLDTLKTNKALRKTKQALKHRFWTEVHEGAKVRVSRAAARAGLCLAFRSNRARPSGVDATSRVRRQV